MPKMFLNGDGHVRPKRPQRPPRLDLLGPTRTAGNYRFFAVRDEFPGLLPVSTRGRMIEGELYDIPEAVLRDSLLPAEPRELELGEIELADGSTVNAMLLVPSRLEAGDKVVDIAELGGFRNYQAFLAANERLDETLGR